MNTLRHLLCSLALLGLVACGGHGGHGGDSGTGNTGGAAPSERPWPPPANEPAAPHALTGSWGDSGTASVLLVAPDGAVYGLLSQGTTVEVVRGTLDAANGLVPSGGFDAVELNTPDTFRPLSVTGSYQSQSQLLLSSGTQGPLVNAVYDPVSDRSTAPGETTGTYEATVFTSNALYADYLGNVDDNGNLNLRYRGDNPARAHCQIVGQMTTPATDSAILNVSLAFVGEGCQLPDGSTLKGLALFDPFNNQLSLFGMSEDGRTAVMVSAHRARA